jgi:bifunctional NMN adenylyltransferase/nudix hydrolase
MQESVGVLYAPFQTSSLLEVHRNILTEMQQAHVQIVIALPVRRVTPTKNAPLDYATREAMIRQYFASFKRYIHVVPVVDRKYPKNKVVALEDAVKSLFSNSPTVCLYADTDFMELYLKNGGMWKTKKGNSHPLSIGDLECLSRKAELDYALVSDDKFRRGVIFGLQSQFPISWPTVDIAIRRVVGGKVLYLFGKKPGEHGWRFPGGFKDRKDSNFESAVWREAMEEVLKKGIEPQKVFEKPCYVSSRNVNDWRYKDEVDGITTLFYVTTFMGTEDQIKAGDDLCDTKWFCLEDINQEEIEGEHIYLYQDLCEYEKQRIGPQHCNVCNTLLTCDCGIPPK